MSGQLEKCYCGLDASFDQCCGQYINQGKTPQTPEQLMRSRYSAFNVDDIDYIKQTSTGAALKKFDYVATKEWANSVIWQKLEVQSASQDGDVGFVEFVVTYLDNDHTQTLHEKSKFKRLNNRWFYSGAMQNKSDNEEKCGRNDPCFCGSGKKYKKCCLK